MAGVGSFSFAADSSCAAYRGVRVRRPLADIDLWEFGRPRRRRGARLSADRLSRAVDCSLRIGTHRPRCIVNAVVLYRLLREQGDQAELIIGLPATPADKDAHAWVEIDGVDVGPPPGRSGHRELARFG
jgi:Transglutaminase-like superfamily